MANIFIYGNKEKLTNYRNAFALFKTRTTISEDVGNAKNCNALLLAGGGDVCPCLYGKNNIGTTNLNCRRDIAELFLIRKFLSKNLPIFGICRGLQIINVYFGGTLVKDMPTKAYHIAEKDLKHSVNCTIGGFLYDLYGKNASVNSAHHQCIERLAQPLEACAFANDKTIEAVQNKRLKIFAVQFHPERMIAKSGLDDGKKIISFFISVCNRT